MNTDTISAPAKATVRQTWVQYIAVQLGRAHNFRMRGAEGQLRARAISDALKDYVKKHGPSGSGIDCGTTLLLEKCDHQRITLFASFHHMDGQGGYDGWTEHSIAVEPSFTGIDVRVRGVNRNGIKDYLGELYDGWLNAVTEHPALVEQE